MGRGTGFVGGRNRARLGAVLVAGLGLAMLAPVASSASPAPSDPSVLPGQAAAQIQAISDEKASRSPAEQKVDSNLLYAVRAAAGAAAVAGAPSLKSSVTPDKAGRVAVTLSASVTEALLDRIRALGGTVEWAGAAYDSVRARVPLGAVIELAGEDAVRSIAPAAPGESAAAAAAEGQSIDAAVNAVTQGSKVSEGDTTLDVATARNNYGVDGTGVKVCVVSGGIMTLADRQASGDIGAVDIIDGTTPGASTDDGGTVMLEVIHDLAPGATLGFASGYTGIAAFAQNILGLQADGCHVIVDDVTYRDERQFQDSAITQAIATVKAAGVFYVTSAGNGGNAVDGTATTWEGNFADGGASVAPLPTAGYRLHQFAAGVTQNTLGTATLGPRASLEWSDVSGASANDYDLYLLNPAGNVASSSTNVQSGSQDPYEYVEASGASAGFKVVIVKANAAASRYLRLSSGSYGAPFSSSTGGSMSAHHAAPDAIAVAATPARSVGTPSGPYPGLHTSASLSERFSSDGPSRRFFLGNGTAITPGNVSATGGSTVPGPLATSADRVSVSSPQYSSTFAGTSASSAHLAGIVALAKQAKPTLTPDQLRTAVAASAIDIEGAGRDAVTGHGVVMAPALLASLGATGVGKISDHARTLTVSTGNAGAGIDPGETVDVLQTLKNTGIGPATNVSAKLTSTNGPITINTNTVAYPDLAAGATATPTNGPLRFTLSQICSCADDFDLKITVTYTTNGKTTTTVIPFNIVIGTAGAVAHKPYLGPTVTIPSGDAYLPIQVGDIGAVEDVTFSIDGTNCTTDPGIEHPNTKDLLGWLYSPSGTIVRLFQYPTNGGANMCQTVFTDAATSLLSTGTAPYTGSFRGLDPLHDKLWTESAEGTWLFRVGDYADTSKTGTISKFSIHISPRTCVIHGTGVGLPGAPTNVTGIAGQGLGVTVSWDPPPMNGGQPYGYIVTPYLGSAAQVPIYVSSGTTKFIGDLKVNSTYTFKVAALTSVGTGPRSAASPPYEVTALPSSPNDVEAVAGDRQATVSWEADFDGGKPITSYIVVPYIGYDAQTPVPSAGTGTTKVVTGLTNGTTYTFRVKAVNGNGAGSESFASDPVTPMASGPPYAPFGSWAALVNRQFTDLTTKPPSASSSSSWVSQLSSSAKTKGDLADALRRGSENASNVDPVVRVYRAFLGRAPDAGGLQFWIKRKRNVAPAKTWSVTQIATEFTNSNEFKTKYGSLTNRQFVTQIYTDVLGRAADPSGVNYWTGKLDRKEKTKAQVVVGFSESNEYKTKQAQNTDVAVAYIYLLGRAPNTVEASDWVNRQKAGTSHVALLNELLNSPKYATHITG